MLRFEEARLLFYRDIERCPYHPFSEEARIWNRKQDKKNTLIALERYLMILDYLHKTHQYLKD